MIIFDGRQLAKEREVLLKQRVLMSGKKFKISAILFTQDSGSRLYTKIKQRTAKRVGIEYEVVSFSLTTETALIVKTIKQINQDASVTGIIIQKPTRSSFIKYTGKEDRGEYDRWWLELSSSIALAKDVDGLHPTTVELIKKGQAKVLPATCLAVLSILERVGELGKVAIIGRSDLLGTPLFYELKRRGVAVSLLGRQELTERVKSGLQLLDMDTVISATGVANLIKGGMIKQGVILVDVGAPKGDIEFESVKDKASFITPVPGGVGPMTVVSLLENCLELIK